VTADASSSEISKQNHQFTAILSLINSYIINDAYGKVICRLLITVHPTAMTGFVAQQAVSIQ